jgi:hypothetical protein
MSSLVQAAAVGSGTAGSPGSELVIALTGITAGSTLVVCCGLGAANISCQVQGGSLFTKRSNTSAGIFHLFSAPGGNYNILIFRASGSGVVCPYVVYEIASLDSGGTAVVGSHSDGSLAAGGTHSCAPSGSIDTTLASFIVTCGVLNATGVTLTETGAWTKFPGLTSTTLMSAYWITGAVTDERGQFTHSTNARSSDGLMVAFPDVAAGGSTWPGWGGAGVW